MGDKDICTSNITTAHFGIDCNWGGSSCLPADGRTTCSMLTDKHICRHLSRAQFDIGCNWGGISCLSTEGGAKCDDVTNKHICRYFSWRLFKIACEWKNGKCSQYRWSKPVLV